MVAPVWGLERGTHLDPKDGPDLHAKAVPIRGPVDDDGKLSTFTVWGSVCQHPNGPRFQPFFEICNEPETFWTAAVRPTVTTTYAMHMHCTNKNCTHNQHHTTTAARSSTHGHACIAKPGLLVLHGKARAGKRALPSLKGQACAAVFVRAGPHGRACKAASVQSGPCGLACTAKAFGRFGPSWSHLGPPPKPRGASPKGLLPSPFPKPRRASPKCLLPSPLTRQTLEQCQPSGNEGLCNNHPAMRKTSQGMTAANYEKTHTGLPSGTGNGALASTRC
jgi:hypothetical protein